MRKVFPTITDNYFIKDIKAEDGSVLARYTHSGLRTDDVLAVDISSSGVSRGLASQSGSYFYLKDGLGSVQAITTESGNLVQRYIYSSFGKLLKVVDAAGLETTSFKTPFTYTNRELDEESGLYYFRARYYDPGTGRFLTEDLHPGHMSSPATINSSYIYSLNNPTNRTDPSGMFSLKGFLKDFSIVIGASLAGAWSGAMVGGAVGGPWGIVLGAVVGAIAGAASAVAINGVWNVAENKKFFEGWEKAALVGAITGGIAGGFAAYGAQLSAARNPASVEVISEQNPLQCFAQTVYSLGITFGSLFVGKSPKYPNMEGTDGQGNLMIYNKCRANGGVSGACSYTCGDVSPGI